MGLDLFRARMDEFAGMMKSRALRPGFSEILLPGEQEARRAARKSKTGVPLENGVLEDLLALQTELGIAEQIAIVGPWSDSVL